MNRAGKEPVKASLRAPSGAARLSRLSINAEGFLTLCADAEERLWSILGRARCNLGKVPIDDLERAIREDVRVTLAPSVALHVQGLRVNLEQALARGRKGECPADWTEDEWQRVSDPKTIRAELARLGDAVALRPLKASPRGGRPKAARALTKRFEGLKALKVTLTALIEKAYFEATKRRVIIPGSLPNHGEMITWILESADLRTRLDRVPELQRDEPHIRAWMLATRLDWLAVNGYGNQRFSRLGAHWATELRKGVVGMPFSETKGHRLKRGKQTGRLR